MLSKKSMQINVAKYRHLGTSLSRSKKKQKKQQRNRSAIPDENVESTNVI